MKLVVLLLVFHWVPAQEKYANKIVVTMRDTAGIYIKIKTVLANSDYIVKENYNLDTISTHPKEVDAIKGYMIVTAIPKGNVIVFSGIYGFKRVGAFGNIRLPGGYKHVIYYSGSKTWKELKDVAIKMQGELTYE